LGDAVDDHTRPANAHSHALCPATRQPVSSGATTGLARIPPTSASQVGVARLPAR
jgi:hypothetical protein